MPLSRDVLFRIRDRWRDEFQASSAMGGRTARIGICSPVERLEGYQETCLPRRNERRLRLALDVPVDAAASRESPK